MLKAYLNFAALNNRVRETQFPSTVPVLSTVGTTLLRQATYKAHASQWRLSPWKIKLSNLKNMFAKRTWSHHEPVDIRETTTVEWDVRTIRSNYVTNAYINGTSRV